MSLTAICTTQLIFNIMNVLVDSRLSLVDHGEPLRPVASVPSTLIVSLIFLPLLGLIAVFVFMGHQFPPVRILKKLRVTKYKSNNNIDILTKQILCKIAFKSKVNQVLDNLYNTFFRLFNAQITAKDTLFPQDIPRLKACVVVRGVVVIICTPQVSSRLRSLRYLLNAHHQEIP